MTFRYLATVFAVAFIFIALLCLGIAMTTYPWHLTLTQTIGLALIYLTVDTIVAALIAAWVTHDS